MAKCKIYIVNLIFIANDSSIFFLKLFWTLQHIKFEPYNKRDSFYSLLFCSININEDGKFKQ